MMSFQNEVLKELFPQGLISKTLHGIYGKAGSGKTTLVMEIIKEYISRGINVAYIDTENGFFIERFVQINGNANLELLHIKRVMELKELNAAIHKIKATLKENSSFYGLVVIDSLSNPYRIEIKDENSIWSINRLMSRTIFELKKLAVNYSLPVVATHQVYVNFDTGEIEIVGRDLVKYDFKVMVYLDHNISKRRAILTRHPYLGEKEIDFVIYDKGIKKKKLF